MLVHRVSKIYCHIYKLFNINVKVYLSISLLYTIPIFVIMVKRILLLVFYSIDPKIVIVNHFNNKNKNLIEMYHIWIEEKINLNKYFDKFNEDPFWIVIIRSSLSFMRSTYLDRTNYKMYNNLKTTDSK